ncbi:MAG TPA: adenosine deaminase, partial [Vibrio sp.]|nr:adenosine deaminase [Vibrio sp.]
VANAHPLTENELAQFSINAVEASFISPHAKEDLIAQVRQYLAENTH